MAQYHFSKHGRYGRRVEIRKGGFHISVGALVGAFLLACLVWLYMEGYELRHAAPEDQNPDAVAAEVFADPLHSLEDSTV